jgi:hypothetical protein
MLTYFTAVRPKPGFLVDQAPNTHGITGELFATVKAAKYEGSDAGRVCGEGIYVLGRRYSSNQIKSNSLFSFSSQCRQRVYI